MTTALNTLFVTQDGAFLHKEHETVVVEIEGKKRLQMPYRQLSAVVCLARVMASPDVLAALVSAGVHVAFFDSRGRFLVRVEGVPGGNVLLRRAQYRTADDEGRRLGIAKSLVAGKLANTRGFLLHASRDADDEASAQALRHAGARVRLHLRATAHAPSLDALRGQEGIAAREYFQAFSALFKHHREAFAMEQRSRRPPLDPVNAALSFGYTLLQQDCASACLGAGLDPAVGFLHEDRPGRLGLALDLMEELRAPVVDRLVVALVNRGQLGPDDFLREATGACRFTDPARKRFIVAYQEAKKVEVMHPMLTRRVPWGQVPHLQALLLARHLRGDLAVHPPFTMR